MDESSTTPTVASSVEGKAGVTDSNVQVHNTGNGKPTEDRPAEVPEPAISEASVGETSLMVGSLGRKDEDAEQRSLADAVVSSEEGAEVYFKMRDGPEGQVDMLIPPVSPGNNSRERLVEATKTDPSLAAWRKLADKREQGFSWDHDLLYQATTTHVLETAPLIALPEVFRKQVLVLAHDKLGHLGARKVKALVKQRFTWPNMGRDTIDYCRSCEVCQRCSKAAARKAPLIERGVIRTF